MDHSVIDEVACQSKNRLQLSFCSDFHSRQHFFGLVGGFFVGLSVTLWLGMTLGVGYSMT